MAEEEEDEGAFADFEMDIMSENWQEFLSRVAEKQPMLQMAEPFFEGIAELCAAISAGQLDEAEAFVTSFDLNIGSLMAVAMAEDEEDGQD